MIKVTVSTTSPSPSGLVVGLRVEHTKAGWIRFASTLLVVDDLDNESRAALTRWLNASREGRDESEQEPLPLDWG